MSAFGVRRAIATIWKQKAARSMPQYLHVPIFSHLLRIIISLILLPLDNTILIVVVIAGFLSSRLTHSGPINQRRTALQDVQFYPKTVLVTGVDTPHGLAVARSWYHEGHHVVGAVISDSRHSSGERKSRALVAFYRIPRSQYVGRLLDIIHREKVDIWIPCSQGASVMDDAVAKHAIESKTHCKCIALDLETANQWGRSESFTQYLTTKGLPVVENHQVQSRDSIHKILHRSPTKIYHMRRATSSSSTTASKHDHHHHRGNLTLPKRTLSLTYSEVSEIQVSKESPWLMQQYARMGEFLAEMLLVRGQVNLIKIRPAHCRTDWGHSPLNRGLATAIHNLMDRFAQHSGPQVTGHLCLRLLVDEELDLNSVRYVVHIAGCVAGAAAIQSLLQDSPSQPLVEGYLAVLASSPEHGVRCRTSVGAVRQPSSTRSVVIARTPSRRLGLYQTAKGYDIRKVLPALYPLAQRVDDVIYEASDLLLFWKNWRFALTDPLPWWWDAHVSVPLRELDLILHPEGPKGVKW